MQDIEQLRLDLEDAEMRLAKLQKAVLVKQKLEEDLRSLQSKVKSTKTKLRDAKWNVEALLNVEGRRG